MPILASTPLRPSLFLPGLVALSALVTLALAPPGCGGNVVVDGLPPAGSGGSGGAGGAGGFASTTGPGTTNTGSGAGGAGGAGGFASTGTVTPGAGGSTSGFCTVGGPGEQLACVLGGVCPPGSSVAAATLVRKALGLCDPSTMSCCGNDVLEQIVCGPSPSDGSCCYVALTGTLTCG